MARDYTINVYPVIGPDLRITLPIPDDGMSYDEVVEHIDGFLDDHAWLIENWGFNPSDPANGGLPDKHYSHPRQRGRREYHRI